MRDLAASETPAPKRLETAVSQLGDIWLLGEATRGLTASRQEAVLARLVDGGLFATFIDWRSIDLVIASGRELALDLINVVVWVKTNGGQESLWRSQHELLPVFKKGSEPHVNNVELGRHGRWRSNVWEYAGASSLGSDARDALSSTRP